jgi:hypothetical protein
MPSLIDLPTELISQICGYLDRKDTISLRHTSRQLAIKSLNGLIQIFDSLIVTCSKAGLDRLAALVAKPTETPAKNLCLKTVKHVTIHVLTAFRLKELTESVDNQTGTKSYFHAYVKVRKVLKDGLNALPNLETITFTNDLYDEHVLDPKLDLAEESRSNPLVEGLPRPTSSRMYQKRHALYAFESALGVVSALNNQDIDLRVVINYGNESVVCDTPSDGLVNRGWKGRMLHMGPTEEKMFGHHLFKPHITLRKCMRRLTLRYGPHNPIDLNELVRGIDKSSLTHLTFDHLPYTQSMNSVFAWSEFSFQSLTYLKFVDCCIPADVGDFFVPYPAFNIQSVELQVCHAEVMAWRHILPSLVQGMNGKKLLVRNGSAYHSTSKKSDKPLHFDVYYDADRRVYTGRVHDDELNTDMRGVFEQMSKDFQGHFEFAH